MSKFCGVISKNQQKSQLEDSPLVFQDLDILTNWLMRETDELTQDFETKCQATMEREKQMLQNEANLIKIKEQLELCKSSTVSIEWELENCEQKIQNLEANINTIETKTTECINCSSCKSNKYATTERDQLYELLLKIDETNSCLNVIHEEFVDYEKNKQMPPRSVYSDIGVILDLHVNILLQVENRSDCLLSKAQIVDEMLHELKVKMTARHKLHKGISGCSN